MFGMLDYRANKLYILLFGIPLFILRWATIIGLPFLYYELGLQVSNNRILQILVSLLAVLFIEILLAIFLNWLDKAFMFIFNIFVDVIPSDGRTKEEAEYVVKGGSNLLELLEFSKKDPKDWNDNNTAFLSRGFFHFFFQHRIQFRIDRIQAYYKDNHGIDFTDWNTRKFLKDNGLEMSLMEKIITSPIYRGWVISYSIILYLIIFNPWG